MIELEDIWQDYGLDELETGMEKLFPEYNLSLNDLLEEIMTGDILGAMAQFLEGIISGMSLSASGMKNLFVWLIILGVVAAVMTHFIEIFDKHQVADLGFYFVYLLMTAVLLKCFSQIMLTASETIENIVLFVKLLVPTYLLSVGLATGTTTVGAYYQLILLLIYGTEKILVGVVIPLVYSLCILSLINGIWVEEKLGLLIKLVEKIIGWILKAALGIVTGVSIFQSVITPVIDSVKSSTLQKMISAIPGVGNAADGVVDLVVGSAVVIKNSIGIVLLILLLVLCAAPLLQIFLTALLLKGAASLMGIVGNKRITACVDHTGDASMLLFRTAGTAMFLFLITLSILATATNRGF
ncbi:MAG: stage III sporulation protein AE [Eubacterium sp.]|nr:stage III sporulation protein AE [Eubacterium sp.]